MVCQTTRTHESSGTICFVPRLLGKLDREPEEQRETERGLIFLVLYLLYVVSSRTALLIPCLWTVQHHCRQLHSRYYLIYASIYAITAVLLCTNSYRTSIVTIHFIMFFTADSMVTLGSTGPLLSIEPVATRRSLMCLWMVCISWHDMQHRSENGKTCIIDNGKPSAHSSEFEHLFKDLRSEEQPPT